MTEQIRDRVRFNDYTYWLVGNVGGELVTPGLFGMCAGELSTACIRGYHIDYEIDAENRLCLRKLTLRAYNDEYKPVHGVEPVHTIRGTVYDDLDMQVPFSGKLRIGTDPVAEGRWSRHAPAFMDYQIVLDLGVRDGRLVEVQDRSGDVKRKREWVAASFGRSYEPNDAYDDLALAPD